MHCLSVVHKQRTNKPTAYVYNHAPTVTNSSIEIPGNLSKSKSNYDCVQVNLCNDWDVLYAPLLSTGIFYFVFL